MRSMKRRYLSHCRNSVKNCFPRKISLKSDNRLLSYNQQTIFTMAAARHLEFQKFSHSHLTHRLPNLQLCANFDQNWMIFLLRYGDFTIFKMTDLRHLEF